MPTALKFNRSFYFLMLIIVLGGLCIVDSGCATKPKYQSKASSPVEVAQVRGAYKFHLKHWYSLRLNEVDGIKTKTSWWADWTQPILIDPGDRVMKVECRFPVDSAPASITVDLTASLQAGHTYQLRCGIEDDTVTFWVEDMETHMNTGKQVATVSTTPATPAQTAAKVSLLLLLRVLILIGTGG